MKTSSSKQVNKQHWDNLNTRYSNVWVKRAKKALSEKETGFINTYLRKSKPSKVLDIGVGNGRILSNLIKSTPKGSRLYGMDISDQMVKICKEKFRKNPKVKKIIACDVSQIDKCFKEDFSFITSIRVLKYNKDWPKILKKIHLKLTSGGIFVFDMLNENSINRFFKYEIPMYRTNENDLRYVLEKTGFEILDMKSFSRLPDILYELSENDIYVSALLLTEKILSIVLGNTFLGRILFVAVRKK